MLATRLLWSIVTIWIALSGAFFAFALSPDDLQWTRGGRSAYREARNYGEPLADRYLAWVTNYLNLDLGSTVQGTPIGPLLATRLEHTLAYLIPATLLALIMAVGVGYLLATRRGSGVDIIGSSIIYFFYGVPAYVLAAVILWVAYTHLPGLAVYYSHEWSFYSGRNLVTLIPPALLLSVNMLAVWFRYARMEFIELLDKAFVKTLRANGAGTRAIFSHLLRNASKTLLTVVFVEMVSVTVITTVVVEQILSFPGYGLLVYQSVFSQDIGLIMATMLVPLGLAVFGNLIQDVVYPILDPRIDAGNP